MAQDNTSRTVEEWKLVWARIGAEIRLRELLDERDLIVAIFPELASGPGGRRLPAQKKTVNTEETSG